jgi:hypothetical protein
MIAILCLLFGLLFGVFGSTLVRHRASSSSSMLADLRETLEGMERDYRLRVATEELSRETTRHLEPPNR